MYGIVVPSGHSKTRLSQLVGSGGGGCVAGGWTVHIVLQSSAAAWMSTQAPEQAEAHCAAV